jgi:flagellar motor switch protein FliN/FliY
LKENLESIVKDVDLEVINESKTGDDSATDESIELINNVEVNLEAKIGDATTTVKKLYELKEGELLKLDSLTTDPIDILLNGNVIMQGELVAVDDNFGIKITKLNTPNQ